MAGLKRVLNRQKTTATATLLPSVASRTTQTHQLNVIQFFKKYVSKLPAGKSGKRMRDSYVEDFLRFKSDPSVYEGYRNLTDGVRIGKVLEDIDALAAMIGFAHASTPGKEIQVVTASLDRIDLLRPIPTNMDIKLSGFVTFVGNSSMEVSIRLETVENAPLIGEETMGYEASFKLDQGELLLKAKFIMVAIDPANLKPISVSPLEIESTQDQELFQSGAQHKTRKQVEKQLSLKRKPPVMEEMVAIHQLYLNATKLTKLVENQSDMIWMEETKQKSLVLTLPEDRNLYNKIFGGYLMRVALELAYTTCVLTAKSDIRFLSLDDIMFHKSVNVGSILSLTSVVSYSKLSKMQVDVIANVVDPKTGAKETTNEFHFVFESNRAVPQVIPKTYEESVAYIEAQSRFRNHNH
jgi:acyl-coenzyme A thioesterase 9